MNQPIWRGRVTCGDRARMYFEVRIWHHRRDMQAWARSQLCAAERRKCARQRWQALVVRFGARARRRSYPCLGVICFCLDHLGAGVMAHELLHATVHWFSVRKLFSIERHEERWALAHDSMYRQLNAQLHDQGVFVAARGWLRGR
jgi:hypothetical protein